MNLIGDFSMKLFFAFFLSCFVFAQASQAQSLVARTDAREVLVRNTFEVTYEFSGQLNNSFRPPAFKGLEVVAGPFRGSETNMYNGKVTRKTTYSYTLAGLNPGTYEIKPASVTYKGKKIFSNSLTIKIVSGGASSEGYLGDVFLETIVLDTPAYPGSQVNVNYVLHTSINLADMGLRDEDEYQSFIVRNLKVDENGQYEVRNGKQYLRKVIKQVALYPTEAGLVKVKPLTIDVEVPEKVKSRNTSLIEQFFSSTRYNTKILKSDPIEIRTKRFPRPIPNNFSGATGRLEMETVLGDKEISMDDAVSLKVQLTGTSNPTEIKAPFLEVGDDFTVFPAKVIEDTLRQNDGKLAFQKTFEYLIQPQKVGKFNLLVKTSYFDNVSESFKEIKSPLLKLNVAKGVSSQVDEDDEEMTTSVSYMPFVWGILGLLILLFGLYVWKRSHRDILPEKITEIPNSPKLLKVKKSAEETKELAQVTDSQDVKSKAIKHFNISKLVAGKEYLQEVLNETEIYFEDKLQLPHGQFKKDQVFDLLKKKGNSTDDIQELKSWWTRMEAAIYANMPMYDDESVALKEIKNIIKKLNF